MCSPMVDEDQKQDPHEKSLEGPESPPRAPESLNLNTTQTLAQRGIQTDSPQPKDLEQAVMASKFVPLPATTREDIPVMSGLDHRPALHELPRHHDPLRLENTHPQVNSSSMEPPHGKPSSQELLPQKYVDPVSEEYKLLMKNKFGSGKIFLDHHNQLF